MNGLELLKQTKVNYYGNVKFNKPLCEISLFDWVSKYSLKNKKYISEIRHYYDTDKKIAKKLKAQNLPCVTITGKFDSYRRIDLCKELNPVMAIDIDRDDNTHITDWDELKKKVSSLPFVFLTSYSCSGKGVYCLIYFNKDLKFTNVFNALVEDFKQLDINIDTNCKDITRTRFVSYDDNVLIKTSEVEIYNKEKEIEQHTNEFISNNVESNINERFAFKAITYLILVDKYRSDKYEDWLLDGFRLATLGKLGEVLFMYLSQMSENYDKYDAIKQFNICYKTTKMNLSCITYYYKLLKEKHGKNWIDIINNYTNNQK